MSDARGLLIASAERLFASECTRKLWEAVERGEFPSPLWSQLENNGLTIAARSEDRGGLGTDFEDVCALIRTLGRAAAPAPLAETFLAERLLQAVGFPPIDGVATTSSALQADRVVLKKRSDGWTLDGRLHQVAWGRYANAIVAVGTSSLGFHTIVVRQPRIAKFGTNYAGEPRDDIQFEDERIDERDVSGPNCGWDRDRLMLEGALFRLLAMTGALETVLQLTVRYAQERVQFGRPIGKFQAVQQQISVLAAEVAAAVAASQGSIHPRSGVARFEIAAAKLRVGEAAGIGAGIAHQVHGAMGFTHEHALQLSTRRLWSWRDEFGSEAEWAWQLGRVIAGMNAAELWASISNPEIFNQRLQQRSRSRDGAY